MNTLVAYIDSIGRRVWRRDIARYGAAVAAVLLLMTAVFAWAFVRWVPGGGVMIVARIALFVVIGLGLIVLLIQRKRDVVGFLESHVPQFAGRLRTWHDATRHDVDSALLPLLAAETTALAEAHADKSVVRGAQIAWPAVLAGGLVVALVVLVATGNNPLQLAAKRLWTGDLFTATAPRIVVLPGDAVVPKGRNVVIEAQALGFSINQMQVHALFENGRDWEEASMSRLDQDKYGFVFVGVSEALEYYVAAKGVASARHVIHVADLPRVTKVSLTYEYPSWTGVQPQQAQDGDVDAIAGTEVSITATTDKPIVDPLIVVNEVVASGRGEGTKAQGEFTVDQSGSWYIAVRHEGTLAQISDTYLINTVPDKPPEVEFTWPGHDGQATSIEEVGLRFSAKDDFVVEELMMNYSVNGGEWVQVPLELEDAQHRLFLEEMQVPATAPSAAVDGVEVVTSRALAPGDMISFFAEARDHSQTSKTALYFVDVRPFDRTYRESQSSGGGGGGGDQGGFEIAQRQREIVTATWNLINKTNTSEQTVADQAATLALLQRTLRDQVGTLTARTQARMLTRDEEIDRFTVELNEAATFMEPAAQKLDERALQEAIEPAQKALQHLLAAEATMTDVDVSMSQSQQGRGTSGRSLSELVDLEMDRERNRYETEQSPSLGQESGEDDSDWREIEELARRQEQMAQRDRAGEETLASRWQQEKLKREIEELQERLERQRQRQQSQGAQSQALDNAIAELNEARDAIEQSGQNSGGSPADSQQAASALRDAAQQLRESERDNLTERLKGAERQLENLLSDQRAALERLAQVQEDSLAAARRGEGNPFRNFAMEPFAERKERMQEELAELTRDMQGVSDKLEERDPRVQQMLERALTELQEQDVGERLADSAAAYALGRPLFARDNEEAIERSLQRFAGRLSRVQGELTENPSAASDGSPIAQVRELRRAVNAAAAAAGGGTNNESDRGDLRGDLRALQREADNLEFALREELGIGSTPDTTLDRANYVQRGTSDANDVALARLLSDRLDLLEASLLNVDRMPIRAQRPRDTTRDSDAAAEYFRELSVSGHEP